MILDDDDDDDDDVAIVFVCSQCCSSVPISYQDETLALRVAISAPKILL